MLIDGKACCTNCGTSITDCGKLDDEETCGPCREKERTYDAGYHEALRTMFDHIAGLIEEDGGLDLIDLVCDVVQERERSAQADGEPGLVELLRRWRDERGEGCR
jgi:hypothetical protein